jgi:ABC-2 type transport system permease protein
MSSPEPAAIAASTRVPRPAVGALALSEIAVLFRRRRTWAMLLALAAIPVLVAIAVRVSSARSGGNGPALIGAIAGNGLFVGVASLVLALPLFLPLTIGVVAGDTIAGEAAQGTLRYLLVVPAGRARLLVVKLIGAAVFCLAAPFAIVVAGTLVGALLFPVGPVTLLSGDQVPVLEGLGRLALIGLYTAVSMLGLTAVGLFVSTVTDVPVGAMATTVVLAVTSEVLDQLPQLAWLHPWLLSDPWLGFVDLLRQPPIWSTFGTDLALQLGYVVVFGALAYGRFTTRDVLA